MHEGKDWTVSRRLREAEAAAAAVMPSAANEDKTVMVKYQLTTMSGTTAASMKAKLAASSFRAHLSKMFRMYGLSVSADAIVVNLQTSMRDKMIATHDRDAYLKSRHETMSPTPAPRKNSGEIFNIASPTPKPRTQRPTPPPPTPKPQSHANAAASSSQAAAASTPGAAAASSANAGGSNDDLLIGVLVLAVIGLIG